uniref:Secretion regulating guanine nucleotide exchange factor n=1 Tax=Sphenodon punctatus TaxID=8508 RepID=A0A8D0L2B4_SPHPU
GGPMMFLNSTVSAGSVVTSWRTCRSSPGRQGLCAGTNAGELFVCGQNREGQLGLNHNEDVLYFTPCTSLSSMPVTRVACGWDFTIILTGNGQVLSCGSNSFGQLGIPQASGGCTVPQKIEFFKEKVVNVAAGLRHALAATESGLVFQWGTGMMSRAKRACQGKTIPSFLMAKEPSGVTGLENIKVKKVTANSYHSVSLTDNGELHVWGCNKHGQLLNKEIFLSEPQKIEANFFFGEKIEKVWSGWTHMVAQTETSKVFTWGRADYGQLGRNVMVQGGQSQEVQRSSEQSLKQLPNIPTSVPCLTGASEVRKHGAFLIRISCFLPATWSHCGQHIEILSLVCSGGQKSKQNLRNYLLGDQE